MNNENETHRTHTLTEEGSRPSVETPVQRFDSPVIERNAQSIIAHYWPWAEERQRILEHMKEYPYVSDIMPYAAPEGTFCIYKTSGDRFTVVGFKRTFETDWEAKNHCKPVDKASGNVRMYSGDRQG